MLGSRSGRVCGLNRLNGVFGPFHHNDAFRVFRAFNSFITKGLDAQKGRTICCIG